MERNSDGQLATSKSYLPDQGHFIGCMYTERIADQPEVYESIRIGQRQDMSLVREAGFVFCHRIVNFGYDLSESYESTELAEKVVFNKFKVS